MTQKELKAVERWKDRLQELKGAKLFRVDGETVKADIWYTLKNGDLVEAE